MTPKRLAVGVAAVVAAALAASPAWAAFPGRNGLLAVAPLTGSGVVLTNARGGDEHRICTSGPACRDVRTPRWSPDGQALAFTSPSYAGISMLYRDGTCLECRPFHGSRAAFSSTLGVVSAISGGELAQYGIDGLQKAVLLQAPVSDAVWSFKGQLAVVRDGRVLAGPVGRLRSLGEGNSPSWSPDGSRLVVVRSGWLTVLGVRRRSIQRLARGSGPTFSPDGKSIAFIGAGHRLRVVRTGGGRVHAVGRIRGRSVDWEPIPRRPPARCVTPPGTVIVATTSTATLSSDTVRVPGDPYPTTGYLGCLLSEGRERVLGRYGFDSPYALASASWARTAGNYVALVEADQYMHYGGSDQAVHVFDLRVGTAGPRLGGEGVTCPAYGDPCATAADGLQLGADGFTAVHTTLTQYATPDNASKVQTEQILASDSTGVHVLDSTSNQYPINRAGPPLLTGLALSGDTLTWDHAGTPQSAQLH